MISLIQAANMVGSRLTVDSTSGEESLNLFPKTNCSLQSMVDLSLELRSYFFALNAFPLHEFLELGEVLGARWWAGLLLDRLGDPHLHTIPAGFLLLHSVGS